MIPCMHHCCLFLLNLCLDARVFSLLFLILLAPSKSSLDREPSVLLLVCHLCTSSREPSRLSDLEIVQPVRIPYNGCHSSPRCWRFLRARSSCIPDGLLFQAFPFSTKATGALSNLLTNIPGHQYAKFHLSNLMKSQMNYYPFYFWDKRGHNQMFCIIGGFYVLLCLQIGCPFSISLGPLPWSSFIAFVCSCHSCFCVGMSF